MAQTNRSPNSPRSVQIQATFTRPADTTAYTAKDAVSDSTSAPTAMTFAAAAVAPLRGGRVRGACIHSSLDTPTSSVLDLLLFDASPTPTNDNAEYDMPDEDADNYLGTISFVAADFGEFKDTKSARKTLDGAGIGFVSGSANAIYGLLVARGTYTPASGEVLIVTLDIEQEA